jgi:hypothetical protein
MEIPLFPSDQVPQPKEKIRIKDIEITPYPDGLRFRIHIKVTAFEERPNLLLVAHNEEDQVVSELTIIETMHHDMEFTMHLRGGGKLSGVYTLTADLFYETRNPPQDRRIETFVIPEANSE